LYSIRYDSPALGRIPGGEVAGGFILWRGT